MYLLIYELSSGSYESVYMQARLHGRWRLCTGLFSINLYFSSYFRHSIFLDSCLFKFSL